MISRYRIASVIALCIVSTLACGFSTWIYSESDKADVGEIEVGVGDITTNSSATILFQKAEVFSFNEYGFEHQEEITLSDHKQTQTISYFDYTYQISSLWKINPTTTTGFTYQISQRIVASSGTPYDFLPAASISVSSYMTYDEKTGSLTDVLSGVSGTDFKKTTRTDDSTYLTSTLTVPQSTKPQYLLLQYQNTVDSSADGFSFKTNVFDKRFVKNIHTQTQTDDVVSFNFTLNKVVA